MNTEKIGTELYSEDLQGLNLDLVPDPVSAMARSTLSSFSSMGSASSATCVASIGTLGTASSF